MTRPSPDEILGETARLAYHLKWPLDTILDLEHPDRRLFLDEADELAGLLEEDFMDDDAMTTTEWAGTAGGVE